MTRTPSGQDAAAELPDEPEEDALLVLPDVPLVEDVEDEDDAVFAAGVVADFPPERESVR
ncbi:hypothetical protein [Cellulosimicrobium protaetiae]|uniref:hypothetical protein n=1 Tax=Cellulosimicrobium protaetiae TaxID=2587808 RepID=UPI00300C336F